MLLLLLLLLLLLPPPLLARPLSPLLRGVRMRMQLLLMAAVMAGVMATVAAGVAGEPRVGTRATRARTRRSCAGRTDACWGAGVLGHLRARLVRGGWRT